MIWLNPKSHEKMDNQQGRLEQSNLQRLRRSENVETVVASLIHIG